LFRTSPEKPRGEDFLRNVLEDPLQLILVGVLGGNVVGYAHVIVKHIPASPYRKERRFGEIDTVAVLPEAQRRGLGEMLIGGALEWLKRQGVNDHQIAVHAFNGTAERLYRRFGFAPSVTMLRRKD
jgi:ribosomal protein S18 acetylase RimI-like enzyme